MTSALEGMGYEVEDGELHGASRDVVVEKVTRNFKIALILLISKDSKDLLQVDRVCEVKKGC